MQRIHGNRNEGGVPWQGDELASHSLHASLQDSGMQQLPKHVSRLRVNSQRHEKASERRPHTVVTTSQDQYRRP